MKALFIFLLLVCASCATAQTYLSIDDGKGLKEKIRVALLSDTNCNYFLSSTNAKAILTFTPHTVTQGFQTGDLLYANGNINFLSRLTIGSSTQILSVTGGAPAWITPNAINITDAVLNNPDGTTSTTHNKIKPTVDAVPFWLESFAAGSANLLNAIYDNGAGTNTVFTLGSTGAFTLTPAADVVPIAVTQFGGGTSDALTIDGFTTIDHSLNLYAYNGISAGTATVPGTLQLADGGGFYARIKTQTMAATTDWYWPAADGSPNQFLKTDGFGILSWASAGTGTVTSISAGTGITLTPNPIVTTGSVALTVPVVVSSGGTGATTLTGVVHGNGASAMTAANVNLTSEVTGILPVANGGTNSATNGGWFAFGNSNLPTVSAASNKTNALMIGSVANGGGIAIGNNMTFNTGASAENQFVAIGDSIDVSNISGTGAPVVIGSSIKVGDASSTVGSVVIGYDLLLRGQKNVLIGTRDTLSGSLNIGCVIIGGSANIIASNSNTGTAILAGSNNSVSNSDNATIISGARDTLGTLNSGSGAHFVGAGNDGVILGGTHLVVAATNQVFCGQYNVPVPNNGSVSTSDIWFGVGGGTGIDTNLRKNSVAITGNSKIIVGGRATVTGTGHTSWGSNTGQVKYGFAGSDFFAITTAASHAADETYTIQDAGAAGDFLFETSNLSGANKPIATTSTRGVLGIAPSGTATLSAGTVTVSDANVTANSLIVVSATTFSNPGAYFITAITAATSFVITSTNVLDASTVQYTIYH